MTEFDKFAVTAPDVLLVPSADKASKILKEKSKLFVSCEYDDIVTMSDIVCSLKGQFPEKTAYKIARKIVKMKKKYKEIDNVIYSKEFKKYFKNKVLKEMERLDEEKVLYIYSTPLMSIFSVHNELLTRYGMFQYTHFAAIEDVITTDEDKIFDTVLVKEYKLKILNDIIAGKKKLIIEEGMKDDIIEDYLNHSIHVIESSVLKGEREKEQALLFINKVKSAVEEATVA